jgi:preprotein translocase subunit SecE
MSMKSGKPFLIILITLALIVLFFIGAATIGLKTTLFVFAVSVFFALISYLAARFL